MELWQFTGIYGWPEDDREYKTWQLLRNLNTTEKRPWMCIGDFNEILYGFEKSGGREREIGRMEGVREVLSDCELGDLGFEGYNFTWSNERTGDRNIQERLDRCVANIEWICKFPNFKVVHLARKFSDHCPLLLSWDESRIKKKKRKKRFRFEAMWLTENTCGEVVEACWKSVGEQNPEGLMKKMRECGNELLRWEQTHFGHVSKELERCKNNLEKIDTLPPPEVNIKARKEMENKMADLLRREEMMWQQRSRVTWMRDGDKNTSFFHRTASGRQKRNRLESVIDDENRRWTQHEDISRVFVEYFRNIFSTNGNRDMSSAVMTVDTMVTDEMNESISRSYTKEEVILALSQIHPTKAPGPDEALSSLIRKQEAVGRIHGIRICRLAPSVTHLFFADDNIIFGRANEKEIDVVKEIISSYEVASQDR